MAPRGMCLSLPHLLGHDLPFLGDMKKDIIERLFVSPVGLKRGKVASIGRSIKRFVPFHLWQLLPLNSYSTGTTFLSLSPSLSQLANTDTGTLANTP